ncbi:hypothetical protein BEWA_032320 [Theileria equi strain WA]|uniref:Uncharacterized protein n=1 Tax=Theileria equi strain WA TaxID=1537102 RepID=L0AZT2_THEEQ|nr:hypothetical protein BEWA_032320 [Theileria equi strain WA]AFZ80379.1 hypothetical protein BEWA_032320 [Theileria equi strain WA]|eukprot:XP_004830045.1 hypothetical protein BEWA_032320 [Theileria equi strain WA]
MVYHVYVDISKTTGRHKKTTYYDHQNCAITLIKEDDPKRVTTYNQLTGYKLYTHRLPPDTWYGIYYDLGVINHKNAKQEGLGDHKEYWNSKHVSVYYWKNDEDNLIPLLIGINLNGRNETHFRKKSLNNEWWEKYNESPYSHDFSFTKIFDGTFKKIVILNIGAEFGTSYCSHPSKEDFKKPYISSPSHANCEYITISVSLKNKTPCQGYTAFIHKSLGGSMHILSTWHRNKFLPFKDSLFKSEYDSMTVYYAEGDDNMKHPLLVELKHTSGRYEFYEPNGNSWKQKFKTSTHNYYQLERIVLGILDKYACKVYDAIPIDISKRERTNYRCKEVCSSNHRINVWNNTKASGGIEGYEVYTHTLPNGISSTISRFMNGNKNITIHGISFPIQSITHVAVYFPKCAKNDTPILIHITHGSNDSKWYKRNSKENPNEWVEVGNVLENIRPDDINKVLIVSVLEGILKGLEIEGCEKRVTTGKPNIPSTGGVLKNIFNNRCSMDVGDCSQGEYYVDNYFKITKPDKKEKPDYLDIGITGKPAGTETSSGNGSINGHNNIEITSGGSVVDTDTVTYVGNLRHLGAGTMDIVENTKSNNQISLTMTNSNGGNVFLPNKENYTPDDRSHGKEKDSKDNSTNTGAVGSISGVTTSLTGDAGDTQSTFTNAHGERALVITKAGKEEMFALLSPLDGDAVGNGVSDRTVDGIKASEGTVAPPPPSVTIDISERSVIGWNSTYYDYTYGYRNIEVTPNSRSPQGFTGYAHTIPNKTSEYFTLKQVNYKGYSTGIIKGSSIPNVTSVSVYYWSFLEGPTRRPIPAEKRNRPLLIKIITKGSKGNLEEAYYENISTMSSENEWAEIQGEKLNKLRESDGLEKKLKLLNCRLNSAVIIDLSMKPTITSTENYDACDDIDKRTLGTNHGHSKIKVYKDSPIRTYSVYKHVLNQGGKFHILSFKNGETPLTGIGDPPIIDVDEVRVYFCSKDRDNKPLLIYYHKPGGSPEHNWYKSEKTTSDSDEWKWVVYLPSSKTDDYEKILTELNTLTSTCAPPKVTIDISNKGDGITYQSPESTPSPQNVKVVKTPGGILDDPPPNYERYDHTVTIRPRSYFTVSGFIYETGKKITGILNGLTPMENVTSVSVYYWGPLKDKGNPLLIKIMKSNGIEESEWYENSSKDGQNRDWKRVDNSQEETLKDSSTLQKKLNLLNCRLSRVTVIDIGQRPTDGMSSDATYCHEGSDYESLDNDGHKPKLLKVTDVSKEEQYGGEKLGDFAIYKHTLRSGGRTFHISSFLNNKTKNSVKLDGLPPPFIDVPEVIVYYCSSTEDGKPLVMNFKYKKTPGTGADIDAWYKKPLGTDDGPWVPLEPNEKPKNDNSDIDKKYTPLWVLLDSYDTKCKTSLWKIVISTGGGTLGTGGAVGGAGYWAYSKYFIDALVRLI